MNASLSKKKTIIAIVILTLATIIVVAGAVFITSVIKKSLYQTVFDAKKEVLEDSVENTKSHIDNMRTQLRTLHPEWTEEQIKDEVTNSLRDFIYSMNYIDDSYIWVQEVYNFDGGDKYAMRLIHPNLKDTEGTLLSTGTTDSEGNHPYKEELEGIKKDGHVFLNYTFKELYSDRVSMKLTYSSLYPDYNWIISRGVSINKLDDAVEKIQAVEFPIILVIVIIYGIAVVTILIYAFILWHRANGLEDIKQKLSKEIDLSHKANKARAKFLFELSNDVGTQVDEVSKYTDLAIENIDNREKLEEYLEKVKESELYAKNLLNDANKMVFFEDENIEIIETKMDLRDNTKNIRGIIPSLIKNKDVEIEVGEGEITHYIVYADEIRLRQISMVLLTSAVRFARPGGIIKCNLSEITSKKEGYATYRLVVEDKGVSIPEELFNQMVDILQEGTAREDSSENSTRYSLSIIKRILDSMNGTISMESKIGNGTKFIVDIPFRVAEDK